MHVAELDYPGDRLDYDDKEWAWKIQLIIMSLESYLTEASVSLNLFEAEAQDISAFNRPELSEPEIQRHENLVAEFEQQLGQEDFYRNYSQITELVEKVINREKWNYGQLPQEYKHKLVFMYARCFVHALDISGKLLTVLGGKFEGVPEEVNTQTAKFYSRFPELKGVRDTVEHIEDRVRGKDRNQNPLKTQGGGLQLDNLRGNKFGCTMSDGKYGEVKISAASLSTLGECIQAVINSVQWSGRPTHYPR